MEVKEFELPANVRQIGTISEGLKIYMEDYVNTYVRQLAEAGGANETAAFLVGKRLTIDGRECLFISGGIQGKHVDFDEGSLAFSDKSFSYADEQREMYFDGAEIVGWVLSRPGYGTAVPESYEELHARNFREKNSVLFLIDPIERVNSFFAWDEERGGLKDLKGYFIYYEQNKGMQEYMLENKVVKMNYKERSDAGTKGKPTYVKSARGEGLEKTYMKPDKEYTGSYKKVVNMLVSLSAVLFVICFIMGAGLIQNDGRLNKLERSVSALDSAYGYLTANIGKAAAYTAEAASGVESVFAPNTSATTTDVNPNDGGSSIFDNENIFEVIVEPTVSKEETVAKTEPTAPPTNEPAAQAPEATPEPTAVPPEPTAIPVTQSAPEFQSELPDTYIVEQGDNLNRIAYKFYGTTDMVEAIMELNNLDDPNTIFFGKVLYLPKVEH